MTNRQINLISKLVAACWAHNEKLGAEILAELLHGHVDDEVVAKVKSIIQQQGGPYNG